MAAGTLSNRRGELAHRVGPGIEVMLFSDAADNSTSVEIWYPARGQILRFDVPTQVGLAVFYHPLAHFRTAAAA